jgi:hypothetical protein
MLQILNPFKAGQRFQELKAKKKWILALIIVLLPILLSQIGNVLIQQKNQDVFNQIIEERGSSNERNPSRAPGMIRSPMGQMGFNQSAGMGSSQSSILLITVGIISALVFWILKSGIFHLFSRILGGAQVNLSSTIHLIAYTYLPFIIKGILEIIKGIMYKAPSSPQELMMAHSGGVLMNFINDRFNIFVIWALILMIIAIKVQYELGTKKALLVVLIPYIVVWILQLTVLSSGMMFLGGS